MTSQWGRYELSSVFDVDIKPLGDDVGTSSVSDVDITTDVQDDVGTSSASDVYILGCQT